MAGSTCSVRVAGLVSAAEAALTPTNCDCERWTSTDRVAAAAAGCACSTQAWEALPQALVRLSPRGKSRTLRSASCPGRPWRFSRTPGSAVGGSAFFTLDSDHGACFHCASPPSPPPPACSGDGPAAASWAYSLSRLRQRFSWHRHTGRQAARQGSTFETWEITCTTVVLDLDF